MDLNNEQLNCATSTSISDLKVTEILQKKERNNLDTRSVRQRIPNRQLDSYVLQSTRSISSMRRSQTSISTVSSLSCNESSKEMAVHPSVFRSDSINKRAIKAAETNSKKSKTSPQKMIPPLRRFDIASLGNVTLPWPRYNIKSTMFNGKAYTITNTCSLDSVLFVYYLIFKTASTSMKNLFSRGSEPIYTILNKTMQLVDTNGWNIARLHWLKVNHQLRADNDTTDSTTSHYQDLFGTVDENVYQYLRAMQNHSFATECTAEDCPQRKQNRRSADIVLK
jgi:hypothetical protein